MKKILILFCILALLGQACTGGSSPGSREASPQRQVTLPVPGATSSETPTLPADITPTDRLEPTSEVSGWVEEQLQAMPLEEKIGQLLIINLDEEETQFNSCPLVQRLTPGGVSYHSGNVVSPNQLREFSAAIQRCAGQSQRVPLFIALDHEGQYVNRFDERATMFPASMAQGATGDPAAAYEVARAAGQELAYSGINLIFGPVADVLINLDSKVISQRSFGSDPQRVAEFVAQAVKGYQAAGLLPVLKHFPGHGGVAGDSHRVLPVDSSDRQRLESLYLPPFRSGLSAGAPAVMFSHVAFPNLSGTDLPATLSEPVIQLLRQDLGFQGIILTDAMDMKAVSGGPMNISEASLQALKAGADLLLVGPPEQEATYQRLLQAVQQGEIPQERIDQSLRRILSVKAAHGLQSFPPVQAPEPDWEENVRLSVETGRRGVTLFKDDLDLLPLSETARRILVIGPNSEWEFYPVLQAALQERGIETEFAFYSRADGGPVPEQDLLESLPGLAAQADLTLLFTWQAYLNSVQFEDLWPAQLVQNLLASNPSLIVVALKSPADLRLFPQVPAYLALYGTTEGSLQGLLDALLSSSEPSGQNPLPGLLP